MRGVGRAEGAEAAVLGACERRGLNVGSKTTEGAQRLAGTGCEGAGCCASLTQTW